MRRPAFAAIAAVALLLFWLTPAGQSDAFGTINTGGQKQEHAEITRRALADAGFGPKTLWVLGGGRQPGRDKGVTKFGAVGAPDRPDRGLLFRSEAHCDNGDWSGRPGYPHAQAAAQRTLESCRLWILTNMDAAVEVASMMLAADGSILAAEVPPADECSFRRRGGDPARCRAIEHLGLAMHAAQDFYSHSNWTDDVATDGPVPGLGNTGRSGWLQSSAVPFPNGLISGCFKFLPESWFCHSRIRHDDLSKDKGDVGLPTGRTVRGFNGNFGRATQAAIEDSRGRWAAFEDALRADHEPAQVALISCLIRSDRVDACAPT